MGSTFKLEDITIRTQLQPGDIGYVIYLHGFLYKEEYNYGIAFENYVAIGLHEFLSKYNPERDCVWICEHGDQIIGFLLLMDRGNGSAQLRFFIVKPNYRGIGLGRKLMNSYMKYLKDKGYRHSYLWTTDDQQTAASLYKKKGLCINRRKEINSFRKTIDRATV